MTRAQGPAKIAYAVVSPDPSLQQAVEAVDDPRAGCVATFLGLVRDHDRGRSVASLEYSAHPRASEGLAQIAREVAAMEGVTGVAVHHATGDLRIGDIAVVAAVAAQHRGQAFDACRELVERLKQEVPIWKHQVFTDGDDEWVGVP
ncbi:MAG: molybdenum cofactor biosynthesis protein MoaE [Dermatophilaceae bacterium]